ncbi:MAG: DNRLRE domain-containing protein [Rariglobus sp.]
MNTLLPRWLRASMALGLSVLTSVTSAVAGTWDSVPLGGGGLVTGLATNSNGSAIYCRTDVGGAFRWVPAGDANGNGTWVSISDQQVPFGVAGASNVLGVESLAVDPSSLDRIYLGAADAIWVSEDRGLTWDVVPNSPVINTDGNVAYKESGERIAVDPNNSNIVWYSSRENGLHKGVKQSSGSWVWTAIPATSVPWGQVASGGKGGVIFVTCDKNNGSTIVYAGVFDNVDVTTSTTGGVYKSTDGGSNWTKVPVSGSQVFSTPRRAQVSSSGILYVTGGTNGVFKLTRSAGILNPITNLPADGRYVALALDPNDSDNKIYVADIMTSRIWRSGNAGSSWSLQSTINQPRQEPDGTPSVTGNWFANIATMMVNPANSNELWLGDFFGVQRTREAQNLGGSPGSTWYTLQKGQEETVVLAVKNAPTGQKLLTGLADVGGARYADITARPVGAGGSKFTDPVDGNTTSLDFSEGNHSTWVRSWVAASGYGGTGAYSVDGGVTWATFGQVAGTVIPASATNTWVEWDVAPYLKQRLGGSVTLVVRNLSSAVGPLTFSSKEGANAPQLVVNGTTTLGATADTHVQDGASIGANFGTATTLLAKTDNTGYARWTYLKFNLTGVSSLTTAKLRLFLQTANNTTSATKAGVFAHDVTSWTETSLTWTNRPLYNSRTGVYHSALPATLTAGGGGRIAVSATDPTNFVWIPIGSDKPAHYSKDRGVTWTASTGGPNSTFTGIYNDGYSSGVTAQSLISDRVNGHFYLAGFATWDAATGGTAQYVYRSTDGGVTWTFAGKVANYSSNRRTPQLVATPVAQDVWLCDDAAYNGSGGGLWRSTDGCGSFTKITNVGKVSSISFGKATTGSGSAYAIYIYGHVGSPAVKGVYRSDNLGVSWVKLADPTIAGSTSLGGDRQNENSVFLATGGRGVFHYNSGDAPVAGAIYELEPLSAPGKRLTVTGGGTANGSQVSVSTDANGSNQRWQVQLQADGSYELIPQHATGARLDVPGASDANGYIQISADINGTGQRWTCEYQADGSYELIPQCATSRRLDVNGANSRVLIYSDTNASNQRWRLIKQ